MNSIPVTRLGRFVSTRSGDLPPKDARAGAPFAIYGAGGEMGRAETANAGPPALLIGRVGTVGSVRLLDRPAWATDNTIVMTPAESCDPSWLMYFLRSQDVANLASLTAQPLLTAGSLRDIAIPVIPVADQRRIADFLDDQVARIDNIIAARRSQIALVTAARKSEVISCLLSAGDLTGAVGAAWYRSVPLNWPLRPLRAAWQVIDCKHRTPAYVEAGYPVVSPGDISAAPLDLTRCHRFVNDADYADLADALRRCRVGDIVYSRNASAGTAALVTTDEPFTMGQDVCRVTSARRSQRYLYYLLNFAVAPQLEVARIGSTFTRINIDEIKSLRVPVPPDNDQERISTDIDGLCHHFDAILVTEARQNILMDELKRSLITAAVTGEFDVSAANGSKVSV